MTHEPLPLRNAMHRDNPKGSRLEIANAYAVGRLIDGKAIADAYSDVSKVIIRGMWPTLADAIEAAITEEE